MRTTIRNTTRVPLRKPTAPPVSETRLYSLCNFYLSSIQQGIQTAHVVSELSLQGYPLYQRWASVDKTIIVLNGGMTSHLKEAYTSLVDAGVAREYPLTCFYEEQAAFGANGVMTCFGIILPNTVYDARPVWMKTAGRPARKTGGWEVGVHGIDHHVWKEGTVEAQILEVIADKHLAR
jgi:hypothetical protein